MFKTKDKIESAYPIGTVVSEDVVRQRFYCSNDVMFEKIRSYYGDANIEQTSPHHVTVTRTVYVTVDGYLFTGEGWYPACRDGNQWRIFYPDEGEF